MIGKLILRKVAYLNVYAIIPLISCIAYIVLIAVTVVFGRKRIRGVFLLYLSIAMLWSLFSFLVHWNYFPQHLFLFHELLIVFFLSIPITYYHFVSVYTDSVNLKIWIGYAILAVFAAFTLTGYVIQETEDRKSVV